MAKYRKTYMPFQMMNLTEDRTSLIEASESVATLNVHEKLVRDKSFIKKITKATLTPLNYTILISAFLMLLGGAFLVYKLQPQFEQIHLARMETMWGTALIITGIVLLTVQVSFILYMVFLYLRYKPVKSVTDDKLPSVTVIVPAYNEGKLVWETLLSLAASDYPDQKIQIISIDDGSQDDTWYWMKKAKAHLGDRLSIYQQPKNMGKRHALHRGFKMAAGDVFVTVDSDSIVKKDTLRNLVSPFVTNEKCGAVAGNVRVLNDKSAMIPRMLNVSFVFSFEFVRSAQSAIGSVFCTPGALAAYKKDAVLACLEDWMNQTFMGKPTDIGEDRAMTNMILKQGYHVLFQRNALVLTNIPEKYTSLYKMFIRWERSNVRENIMMSKFAFTKFRKESTTGTRILLMVQWLNVLMAFPFTLLMAFLVITQPVLFISATLLSILIFSSIQMFFYAKKHGISESFWAYPYSIFYAFALFWITPYAIATAGKSGWLTRGLADKN
ncbi:glycosyltransferase [Pedobacter antarcticus]|uniref:glycosyltransferase n=1 Tax=Pedobacter antarcticus TaxID=34086 RepID=UPI001C5632DC|nr:glycosyltransferase [Pedobacter antarcticus]